MTGISGLDRAAMERERLERQKTSNRGTGAKRERSVSPPPVTRAFKAAKLQSNVRKATEVVNLIDSPSPEQLKKEQLPSQAIHLSDSPSMNPITNSSIQSSSSVQSSSILRYPQGVIKKTWAFGHARTPDDIKIEEVLEKQTVRTALLSAFQWDVPWILSKFDLQQTKFVFAMQAKDEATKRQYVEETEHMRKILRLCFPSMEGNINCMHSKLMLLFHPQKLRVVVPTANLLNFDWGETGIMENSVFLIDLPRLDENLGGSANELTLFGQELQHFLKQMGVDDDVREGILNFDFSATQSFAFVHSVGGASYGEDMERTGFVGLSKAVRGLGLSSQKELQIDFTASSIGSLNDEYLKVIHNAARGEIATALPVKTSRAAPKPFQNVASSENIQDVFRIYFPTHETVADSTGGVRNGGTLCLQRRWWEGNNTFPRTCFRDFRSVRAGLLSHNKILFARGHRTDGSNVAWAYVGSSNMSESAWGKMSWDRSKKAWKMGCRNWECGVLVPVPAEKLEKKEMLDPDDVETESEDGASTDDGETTQKASEVVGMDVFAGIVNVPFEYPAREFGDRQPWYFME